MSVPQGQDLSDEALNRVLQSVAVLIDDKAAFRRAAAEAAECLGSSVLARLRERFHRPSAEPPGFSYAERGLGGWLSCWQFAIFEIVCNLGEEALPMLREIAFGPYDWTQANAIEILCRMAARGVRREEIVADLMREMPSMRDTALLYVAGPLLAQVAEDAALNEIFQQLRSVPEFAEAVDELTSA